MVRLGDGPEGPGADHRRARERYCEADPFEGGKQAVAEAWRNLIAVGARPLALTDNLNFGNPEKPEAMGQLVGCLKGIGEAARALDFPIVSGNVSLYNETMGAASCRRPRSAASAWSTTWPRRRRSPSRRRARTIWLVGGAPGWLGQSAWLATVAAARRARRRRSISPPSGATASSSRR